MYVEPQYPKLTRCHLEIKLITTNSWISEPINLDDWNQMNYKYKEHLTI